MAAKHPPAPAEYGVPDGGCPDSADLRRLLRGELSSAEADRIATHVAACPRCRVRTDAIPDTLLTRDGVPRAAAGNPGLDPDATVYFSDAGAAAADDDAAWAAEVSAEDRALLGPPQGTDELGRLGGFRVLRLLGRGGMGIVFAAEDAQLGRRVALKVIRPSLASRPEARERFLREARAAASLEHDHIVGVHQVGEDRGVPFLAMPLLHGESLETRLQRTPRLPAAEVLRIGREIAEGLAAAHVRGLIHRDLKPANVWLQSVAPARGAEAGREGEGGRVKLLDFGIARVADGVAVTPSGGASLDTPPAVAGGEPTHASTIVGTPGYMAPEQIGGAPADPRSDLFSLGCVLYRMATGQLPFAVRDVRTVVHALLDCRPIPAQALAPEIPPPLCRLIQRLLARDRADRPTSAAAVAAELAALESRLPTSGDDAPVPGRPRARRRWTWAGLATCGAVLAVALWIAWPEHAPVADPVPTDQTGDVERRIAAAVLRTGGSLRVVRDGRPSSLAVPEDLPDGPFEIHEIFVAGEDSAVVDAALEGAGELASLRAIGLNGTGLTDAGLARLRGCVGLRRLSLNETRITDAGLESLRGLTQLEYLTLEETDVGDAGLAHVRGLTQLLCLSLSETRATDAGLAHLESLTRLRYLVLPPATTDAGVARIGRLTSLTRLALPRTRVTAAALEHLQGLTGLQRLDFHKTAVAGPGLARLADFRELTQINLSHTPVGDEDLRYLPALPRLELLELGGTQVTDDGLPELRRLAALREVHLYGTTVTDAGLDALASMTHLRKLSLGGTRVTDDGVVRLATTLQTCRVSQ